MTNLKTNIIGLSRDQIKSILVDANLIKLNENFRVKQIWHWLYFHGVTCIDDMTSISIDLREDLKKVFILKRPKLDKEQCSTDGTRKWLIKLDDGNLIETVYIPEDNRGTLCISSQVGCTLNCKFCHTGTQKLVKNLSTEEIVSQLMIAKDQLEDWPIKENRKISNIVFMGMGEPLMNFNNLIKSIEKISSDKGLNISQKRIVVSTSGIPKMIKKLADENLKVNLALSLHSAIEETRNKIMPFSKKFSLIEIKESLLYWYSKTKRRITFEYIVWKDINDGVDDINALVNFCKSIPSKVNLIEYNPIGDEFFRSASQNSINLYKDLLEKNKITVTVRRSRGKDIDAACGQLANK